MRRRDPPSRNPINGEMGVFGVGSRLVSKYPPIDATNNRTSNIPPIASESINAGIIIMIAPQTSHFVCMHTFYKESPKSQSGALLKLETIVCALLQKCCALQL